MKIDSANLQMTSSRQASQEREVRESLRMWSGNQRPDAGAVANRPVSLPESAMVSISEAGMAAQSAEQIDQEMTEAVDRDPGLNLIRRMMEFLTGEKIRVFDAAEFEASVQQTRVESSSTLAATRTSGAGLAYDYYESYTEMEQTSFSASGTVRTKDGQEITFSLELSMTRVYREESSISLRLGEAARTTDPLVLNFDGNAAELLDRRFVFDLDSDGRGDQINMLAPGRGFLVLDRNQDGKVNNGSELFGPTQGDGFKELSLLDDDRNGWIDENDRAFSRLSLWSPNERGEGALVSLADANVGAISLTRIATPFSIKNAENQLLGQVRDSGIFLQENGRAGTIQQIDLTV
jgi:hypothetical protein